MNSAEIIYPKKEIPEDLKGAWGKMFDTPLEPFTPEESEALNKHAKDPDLYSHIKIGLLCRMKATEEAETVAKVEAGAKPVQDFFEGNIE